MRAQIAGATRLAVSWRGQLLDLLFPPRCVNCDRRGDVLCPACRASIHFTAPPFCSRCGQSLRSGGSPCPRCRTNPLRIAAVRAVAYHEGPMRQAVHALKYNRLAGLARPLGALLLEHLPPFARKADAVVAVPLHPERQRERGYNQSELLARELAARLSLPYLEGVRRIRPTADQVGLDAAARRVNVQGAFVGDPSVLTNRRVLLIDDVCTTCATIDECAAAMALAGASRVFGLVLAQPRQVF